MGNTKSPGYETCCKWLDEIWKEFDSDIIKKSFFVCGINESLTQSILNDCGNEISLRYDNSYSLISFFFHLYLSFFLHIYRFDSLHSVLRKLLVEKRLFNVYIDANAPQDNMLDENDANLFEEIEDSNDKSDIEIDEEIERDQNQILSQRWRDAYEPILPPSAQPTSRIILTPPIPTVSPVVNTAIESPEINTAVETESPNYPNLNPPNITPHQAPKRKIIRRTKDQIARGITLQQLKSQANILNNSNYI